MKVLLILAICMAFIVPSLALAGEVSNPLITEMTLTKGSHTIPAEYLRSSRSMSFNENITKLVFEVDNGDPSGKKRVSSVKIDLLDGKGKKRAVAISPALFNQKVSNGVGTVGADDLKDLTELNLDIKVGGPKDGFIVLNVTEYFEDDCPVWDPRWPNCD
jgi:hypothetical protein